MALHRVSPLLLYFVQLFSGKLRYFEPFLWLEDKGGTVNLKSLEEWSWSVIVDEAQVGLAV